MGMGIAVTTSEGICEDQMSFNMQNAGREETLHAPWPLLWLPAHLLTAA